MVMILLVLCFSIFSGVDSLEKCIASVVPFLTTFIVIPKTITEYLFNPKEGDALATILDAIRQHDEKTLQLMIEGDKRKNSEEKA